MKKYTPQQIINAIRDSNTRQELRHVNEAVAAIKKEYNLTDLKKFQNTIRCRFDDLRY